MEWEQALDIKKEVGKIIERLGLNYIDHRRVFCFRSYGSTSRARARIWSFPRIWQKALVSPPGYCLEVISEKFDRMSSDEQKRVLIHELLHIPKNFSGSLLPHLRRNRGVVEILFRKL